MRVVKWIVTGAFCLIGGLALGGFWTRSFDGAKNMMLAPPGFYNGAQYIAAAGFSVGAVAAVGIVTAIYRRTVWSVVRNTTIATWLFVFLGAWFTFTVP